MTATAPPLGSIGHLDTNWIAGRWAPSSAAGAIEVENPATELTIGSVPAGTAEDAAQAVAAAAAAFPRWASTPVPVRIDHVARLVAAVAADVEAFADIVTAEMGATRRTARQVQLGLGLGIAAAYLDVARAFPFERSVGSSIVVKDPAGVVVAITPWNVPLLLTLQKVVPALLAGCTVVLKPSELTPFNARRLAETVAASGLPEGVFNVVFGDGPTVGAALVADPRVDLVSFTGSVRAGREVARLASATVKRVHLELGGKNASIVCADADLESAVRGSVEQACLNTGQACLQWSRLLVPRDRHDEAAALAAEIMGGRRVGDPTDPASDLGPLVSGAAAQRVRRYVARGIDEGATLLTGGPDRPADLPVGHYVQPTVFAGVTPDMTIAREEIFGPVLSVLPYTDENDAVAIANATEYGLHGAVWAATDERAVAVARRIRTGQVDINGGGYNVVAPFGGVKQSGVGRECGEEGLDAFLESKALQLRSTPA